MSMITHAVVQGTQEWLDIRKSFNTASEANAMMGSCEHMSRTELLMQKKTGIAKEPTDYEKKIFEIGHKTEAMARPIAEEIMLDDLFQLVASRDGLLASFDGITMFNDMIFEHKQWNESLAEMVKQGTIPDSHVWQLEQQLFVSGAERTLFMVSNGTHEKMAYCWYESDPVRRQQLHEGWKQFRIDLEEFEPTMVHKLVGRELDRLPSLSIDIQSNVIVSNYDDYALLAAQVLSSINMTLTTEQHFADAEKSVKWCTAIEKAATETCEEILQKNSAVTNLLKMISDFGKNTRDKRLILERAIKSEKDSRRQQVLNDAEAEIKNHIASLEVPVTRIPSYDLKAQIIGKKNLVLINEKVTKEISRIKAELDLLVVQIKEGVTYINENHGGFPDLFKNAYQLAEDFSGESLQIKVNSMIEEHKELIRLDQEHKERLDSNPSAKVNSEKAIAEADRLIQQAKTQQAHNAKMNSQTIPAETLNAILKFDCTSLISELGHDVKDVYSPMDATNVIESIIAHLQHTHKTILENA